MIKNILLKVVNKKRLIEKDVLTFEKKLFVHIPKTAGTSFRKALEGSSEVCRDYGKQAQETSALIREAVYQEGDHFKAYEDFVASTNEWLCGHFPLNKYLNWFSARNVVVFLRDPIEQVLSHYNHFVRYNDFQGDFTAFYKKPLARNLQSKHTSGLPIALLGMVGITEQYSDSLDMINTQFEADYVVRKSNVNDAKVLTDSSLSMEVRSQLAQQLEQDIKLYKQAYDMLTYRKEIESTGEEWCHAVAHLNPNFVLAGCAFFSKSNESVKFDLLKNGKVIKRFAAKGFYGQHPRANFPRNRYIGFRVSLAESIKVEDTLELVVRSTKQSIPIGLPLKSA